MFSLVYSLWRVTPNHFIIRKLSASLKNDNSAPLFLLTLPSLCLFSRKQHCIIILLNINLLQRIFRITRTYQIKKLPSRQQVFTYLSGRKRIILKAAYPYSILYQRSGPRHPQVPAQYSHVRSDDHPERRYTDPHPDGSSSSSLLPPALR